MRMARSNQVRHVTIFPLFLNIMPQTPRVLVVGAGVGGLTLAQGLVKHGIKVTVFERDASSSFRAQGYRFRVNPNGSAALKYLLRHDLFTQFERSAAISRLGGTRMKYDGTVLSTGEGFGAIAAAMGRRPGPSPPGGQGTGSPAASTGTHDGVYTVDRTLFRALLLQNLDIRFGKQITKYILDCPSPGNVTIHFNDGSSETGDFLVGAEGLRSIIRKQLLPNHLPVDTTGRVIYGKTLITPQLLEQFPKELQNWMSMTIDDTGTKSMSLLTEPIRFSDEARAYSAQVLPQASKDYIYWASFRFRPLMTVLTGSAEGFGLLDSDFLHLTPSQTAAHTLKITEKWAPAIRRLLELQSVDEAAPLRICSVKPSIPKWEPSSMITLLGDAVHVMSPTGGVGANTALRDSAALCEALRRAIVDGEGKVDRKDIEKYEADMRFYAGEAVAMSQQGGANMYGQPTFEECEVVDWL
ncbi:hypothetical protein D9757_001253 [Collybiopsis confluens]|uniref:FAD-binding domain-containing protein n=1 Tax=Collybiopsis confluens TaxID=2823264 RepID=A0A8H5MGD4_9AGAR|nr:hypothetical protein D9757_014275 [Collybiopsis confluens]KAF5392962.1 hypothetical protein D9757_001253 [Collybiopsis confluens]